MNKKIPIYFDSVVVDSPIQEICTDNPNVGRLKVRVFTKYGNRNGSYITDEVAEQLINSAISGHTPVVGFFDPSTQSWASHTGPTLANGYGYVENFLGWEPFTDTDGITREYAVFSVILFTEYFEEAKQILGQNQSMELDEASISGSWATINGEEYFVYTAAKMLGFCVIGAHEPCFSVSSFFSRQDNEYQTQYEKFSALMSDLRAQVEGMIKGGEQPMHELENTQEVVESEAVEAAPQVEEQDTTVETETPAEDACPDEAPAEPSEFEALQQQFSDLQANYNELQTNYDAAQNRVTELDDLQKNFATELEEARAEIQKLKTTITEYETRAVNEKKSALFEKYEKIIGEEEIEQIRAQSNDYSYDELESKLAIAFANKQITADNNKVPLPEPQESQFALLMKKYRKN